MSQTTTPEPTTPEPTDPTERKPRGPLVLARPIRNTLPHSTLVKATRSAQIHVLPADATRTLCSIDVSKWAAQGEVAEDAKVTCPICAREMKQAVKDAADDENSGVDES